MEPWLGWLCTVLPPIGISLWVYLTPKQKGKRDAWSNTRE